MPLAYREDPSLFAVGRALGVHHQTGQRWVSSGRSPMVRWQHFDDRPRPGKEPTITAEAKACLVDLACRKAKELGDPHELWTTRLLARQPRANMDRRWGMTAWSTLPRAPCARFSTGRT